MRMKLKKKRINNYFLLGSLACNAQLVFETFHYRYTILFLSIGVYPILYLIYLVRIQYWMKFLVVLLKSYHLSLAWSTNVEQNLVLEHAEMTLLKSNQKHTSRFGTDRLLSCLLVDLNPLAVHLMNHFWPRDVYSFEFLCNLFLICLAVKTKLK